MIKAKLCIDVGCGEKIQPGFIGMDKRKLDDVEIVHDAEVFPWPFEDNSVSVIKMSHFVEHVKPWLTVDLINECWRILEPDGKLLISTPYAGGFRYWQDPTHCNGFNEATFSYFDPREPLYQIYRPKPWRIDNLFWQIHGDIEVSMTKINGENKNGQDKV